MSEALYAKIRAQRAAALLERYERNPVCSWCEKRCVDVDHLWLHIVVRHELKVPYVA